MRKLVLLTVLIMCCIFSNTYAQNNVTYTGKITDAENKPIDAASVEIVGLHKGTITDSLGRFKINALKGSTISVSALNFDTKQIQLGSVTSIIIALVEKKNGSDEVIVTALGIKRSRNLLPYAAETIGGNEVSKTRNSNFITGLSGKIAGLEIRQGNNVGGSTNVVLRGMKSITRSNQAMFVIDGVPIDNNVTNTANQQREVRAAMIMATLLLILIRMTLKVLLS